jgi:CCR4-NOT transcriptional regulation complex NOT5 subunit
MKKKSSTQTTKEQLQKQLDAIAKQEQKEMIEKHYPEFKKLEGAFYKTRNNYSCP